MLSPILVHAGTTHSQHSCAGGTAASAAGPDLPGPSPAAECSLTATGAASRFAPPPGARLISESLSGPGGVLSGITRTVLETALETELADHLGFDKGDPAGRGAPNVRNGYSAKTVHTDVGPVRIAVPRDRAGTFEPQVVPSHARRVGGSGEAILSLYAKGLTTGEIQRTWAEVYGSEMSRDLISRVTDAVNEELAAWRNRPLDRGPPRLTQRSDRPRPGTSRWAMSSGPSSGTR